MELGKDTGTGLETFHFIPVICLTPAVRTLTAADRTDFSTNLQLLPRGIRH